MGKKSLCFYILGLFIGACLLSVYIDTPQVGEKRCLRVKYEQLVLHPRYRPGSQGAPKHLKMSKCPSRQRWVEISFYKKNICLNHFLGRVGNCTSSSSSQYSSSQLSISFLKFEAKSQSRDGQTAWLVTSALGQGYHHCRVCMMLVSCPSYTLMFTIRS